jgi:hypothetical protein
MAHFDRVTNRLIAVKEFPKANLEPRYFGTTLRPLGGSLGLDILPGQFGQPVEGWEISRIARNESLQRVPLGYGRTLFRGKPGRDAMDLGRGSLAGRELGQGLPDDIDPAGRHAPV